MHSFNALDVIHLWAANPTPGKVVVTSRLLVLRSYGIVSDRMAGGKPQVISGSSRTGRICEQTWEAFSRGNCVSVESHPGAFPDGEILRRARLLIGSPYNPLTWCGEQAVAHDLQPRRLSIGILMVALLMTVHSLKAL